MLETATASVLETGCIAAVLGTSIDEIRQILEQSGARQLPVVDGEANVVGMVSHRDLAHAAYQAGIKGRMGQSAAVGEKTVEQVMSRQVMTIEGADAADMALRAMVAHRFHAVPITSQGRLAGMITSTHFLKKVAYGNWPGHEEPIRHQMRSPGHTVDANDALDRAFEAAEWHAQEFVVAVRRYRPLGILSRTAMRLALYLDSTEDEVEKLKATPVHRLLQSLPVLHPETALHDAAMEMLEHRARALPVVDRSRLLLGVLTESDVLRAMTEQGERVGLED